MASLKAVYDLLTGRLVSTGTVLAPAEELAAKGFGVKDIGERAGPILWDAATLTATDKQPDPPPPPEPTLAELGAELKAQLDRIEARLDALKAS